ncbi:4Fe-4S dicluster domain-containing protein [Parvibacter caecicola]|uniref:4Fe-4S dicluster domain-containing protein n=1 Tax=Parvibacter caecicola TaxID=747645 RepID=UPI00249C1AB0|nr:4Fe-4S dicluster domain-containing protein [Parvibacter caecicola]
MTQYGIVTDVNRCVGCLGCSVACKAVNGVPVGAFWNKTLRIGPNPVAEGGNWPDVDLYFLTVSCQHCDNPACVSVCPTEASHVVADGTVQVDKSKCIGCQFCAMACPYGVRYLNEEERVVEKCTLCEQQIAQGELPQCVSQCGGMARWFGDFDGDIRDFKGVGGRRMGDFVEEFSDSDVHALPDSGNKPSYRYILRHMAWQG